MSQLSITASPSTCDGALDPRYHGLGDVGQRPRGRVRFGGELVDVRRLIFRRYERRDVATRAEALAGASHQERAYCAVSRSSVNRRTERPREVAGRWPSPGG